MVKDYYNVLGVRREASDDQIKAAFRELALRFHPDRHSQAPKAQQDVASKRFREISEAYQVLIDAKERATYNSQAHSGIHRNEAGRRYRGEGSYGGLHGDWSRQYSNRHWKRGGSGFRITFSPIYMAYHAVFMGFLVMGLTFGDALGRTMWEEQNSGKSFEDILRARERLEEDRMRSRQKGPE